MCAPLVLLCFPMFTAPHIIVCVECSLLINIAGDSAASITAAAFTLPLVPAAPIILPAAPTLSAAAAADLPAALAQIPFRSSRADFRMPIDSNPFFQAISSSAQGQQMMQALTNEDNWYDIPHFFLSGPSGCGKTSVGFAVAAKQYLIYLECPSEASPSDADGLGYEMAGSVWASQGHGESERCIITFTHLREFLCAEVIARLKVLLELLQQRGGVQAFTPCMPANKIASLHSFLIPICFSSEKYTSTHTCLTARIEQHCTIPKSSSVEQQHLSCLWTPLP